MLPRYQPARILHAVVSLVDGDIKVLYVRRVPAPVHLIARTVSGAMMSGFRIDMMYS
jgi:hypothetical protein